MHGNDENGSVTFYEFVDFRHFSGLSGLGLPEIGEEGNSKHKND